MSLQPAPYRSLYVHVPFCKKRCAYCDFETQAAPSDSADADAYVEDTVRAIRRAVHEGKLVDIETVYIGGGTPTHLGAGLTQILYTLSLFGVVKSGVECTVEANPESVDERLVNDLWALGANRISLGVQSFDDEELAALGRIHTAQDALDAIACIKGRFDNVSVDLMCGIPHQSLESFRESVRCAIDAGVTHVSVYPLTVEEGTPLANLVSAGEIPDVDGDFQADCMLAANELLTEVGFARYEVASYARAGYACRHNMGYWTGWPYLGIGPGAVSMVQIGDERCRMKEGVVLEELDARQTLAEDLMLGMRMSSGVGEDLLDKARAAFPDAETTFDTLVENGLAAWEGGRLVPTERGWLLGNELYGALYELAP